MFCSIITKATLQDIKAIQCIVNETWPITYGCILSIEQISYMINLFYAEDALKKQMEQGHHFYILKEENQIVGFIDIEQITDYTTKLHKIYLLPSFQGKQYGKKLLDFAIEKAVQNKAKVIQLNVNRYNKALGFYQKQGFIITKEVDISIGNGYFMNDYVMEKALKSI